MSNPIIVALLGSSLLAAGSPAIGQARTASGAAPLPRSQFITDMDNEFRKMDADKNGQVTPSEIEQYQKLQAVAQAAARNRAMFDQLDADKNRQLTPAEFARLVQPPPPANPQPMLARMDGNRDNQINLIEHRTATLVNFDRIDVDKDGVVTPAEMKAGGIVPR